MASARGKSRQRRGEFIKQQRRLGRRANVPTPRSFREPTAFDKAARGFKRDLFKTNQNLSQLPVLKELNQLRDDSWDIAKKAGKKAGEYAKGIFHPGMAAVNEFFITPFMKNRENRKIMGDVLDDKEYRENFKKYLMTGHGLTKGQEGYEGSSQAFYDKYTMLAGLASDNQERERLQDIADTAWGNAQITSRLNYGLGHLGYDTMGWKKPFKSYSPDFTGGEGTGFAPGSSPRFNLDKFISGIQSSKAGKDFYNAARAAQANERGDTMMSNALKNYGDRPWKEDEIVGPSTAAGITPYGKEEPVTISDIPPELFIDESQNMTDVFNDYGGQGMNDKALMDTMGAFYEGASADSPYSTGAISPLYSMYPNYRAGNPILSTIGFEDMDEQELLNWGVKNPVEAEYFGFVPPEYPNRSIFE